MRKTPPLHPGTVLLEEFLEPLDISQYRLAKEIHVPPIRISEIVRGKRSISADTALRLGKYFRMTPEFWLNLQSLYDLEVKKDELEKILHTDVKVIPYNARKKLKRK